MWCVLHMWYVVCINTQYVTSVEEDVRLPGRAIEQIEQDKTGPQPGAFPDRNCKHHQNDITA